MELQKENELIIKAVYKRNAIWNKNNPNYSSQKEVKKLWDEISVEINLPFETIKRRWRSLRDLYRVELRKIEQYSLNNLILKSNWHYFDMLSFLKDQIKSKKDFKPNIKNEEIIKIESENKLNIFCNPKDLDFENLIYENRECTHNSFLNDICLPKQPISDEFIFKPNNSRENTLNLKTPPYIKKQALNTINEVKKIKENTWNESEAFFQSLLPHMGNMGPQQKLLCRIELQKIVYNHAYSIEPKTK